MTQAREHTTTEKEQHHPMIDLDTLPAPAWGPTGETVFTRSYARPKPDGSLESWAETVARVVEGNLALVYGPRDTWTREVHEEARDLFRSIYGFEILPAGRHLWASGVAGRQYLFNCHVSGWGETFADHFEFTFLRLMEGGGVGANYSSRYVQAYGAPKRSLRLHVTADETHADYDTLRAYQEPGEPVVDLLSDAYADTWAGAFRVEDSREGWAAALVDLIGTYFADDVRHADRVYSVSGVRGEGSPLRTFGGTASGPAPLARMLHTVVEVLNRAFERGQISPLDAMEIDHAIGKCVVAGGVRRSARMAIVRWDDPAVFDFINAKRDGGHWTTNLSVEVDDRFLALLGEDEGEIRRTTRDDDPHRAEVVLAHTVHAAVVSGMLHNSEPGYWNSSLSDVGEPGHIVERVVESDEVVQVFLDADGNYVQDDDGSNPAERGLTLAETTRTVTRTVRERQGVQATNPCGEIALEPWENCNLGHVNLEAFAHDADGERLHKAHRLVTRFLIRATYGDVTSPVQAERLAANRRIGVGHLGVQGFLVRQGLRYSEAPRDPLFAGLLRSLKREVRAEARRYAFALRIPEPVKVTTVAPTGSIAKMPGATEGIHPVFARYFIRRVRFSTLRAEERAQVEKFRADGYHVEDAVFEANTVVVEFPTKERLVQIVEDLGFEPDLVEDASEIHLDDLLAFQECYQTHYADNAVSFTANVTPGRYTPAEVSEILARRLPRLKGTTLAVDGTYVQAPYQRISAGQFAALEAMSTIDDSFDELCASGACPIR